ncbi:glycosyltransferase family 2 protein [Candidatus Sumerlaeota bacterium]|nr:glycosyltransferase family 2 protein [Candidatus Sumerlaeota bacterium]
MLHDLKIVVLIPCYKVERHIADVVASVPAFVDRIIAVVDGSPDGSLAILQSLSCERLLIISHEQNLGLGAAMATGYKEALKEGADIVVKLDGDGQMQPKYLESLIDPIANNLCDYAKGNRFRHTRALSSMPKIRLLGSIGLTFLTKMASGYWNVTDPQNGYVAIAGSFLGALDFDRLSRRRFFFENEMLIQLNVEEARVLDVPIPAIYADEKSTMSIQNVLLTFPVLLIKGYFWRLFQRFIVRDFSLIAPLYILGSIFVFYGLYSGLSAWCQNAPRNIPTPTGTIMKATIPLILGFQMLLQGVLIEILSTPKPEKSILRRTNNCVSKQKDLT